MADELLTPVYTHTNFADETQRNVIFDNNDDEPLLNNQNDNETNFYKTKEYFEFYNGAMKIGIGACGWFATFIMVILVAGGKIVLRT